MRAFLDYCGNGMLLRSRLISGRHLIANQRLAIGIVRVHGMVGGLDLGFQHAKALAYFVWPVCQHFIVSTTAFVLSEYIMP